MPDQTVFVAYGPGGRFLGYIAAADLVAAGRHAIRRQWLNGPCMRVVPAGTAASLDPAMSDRMRSILLSRPMPAEEV